MDKRAGVGIIIMLNMIGMLCLAYFAIPYLTHDTAMPHPDAMLPMERWDASGMALTFGLIPLMAANALAFMFVGNDKMNKRARLLFLIPSTVCLGIVAHYWITSQAMEILSSASRPSMPAVGRVSVFLPK